MTCWQLFASFFKIGTFTIGGGYAMIPLMEQELVGRRQCLSRDEFLDVLSLSQAMPGVFAVNMATAVGYRMRGLRGAAAAIMGNILMPMGCILALAVCYRQWHHLPWVESAFRGIRPAVVALIAAPVYRLAQTAGVGWRNCWIPLLAALLIWLLGVSPVWIILGAIILGLILRP